MNAVFGADLLQESESEDEIDGDWSDLEESDEEYSSYAHTDS